jgi:aldehyde dehydrogenase (NAD+)
VYVQEGIYDKFVEGYKKALIEKSKTIGDPDAESTVMGPLIDKAQFDRVSGFIERGKNGQGTLLTGGSRVGDKGFFIEPTVFTDVQSDAEIITQEIFGPVAVLGSFKTEEEIIEKSNNTNFGLMAGVFTQDINKALRMASEFDSGMVGINCVSLMMMSAPFGGSKESGLGRECGKDALEAFTEKKTIMINMTY